MRRDHAVGWPVCGPVVDLRPIRLIGAGGSSHVFLCTRGGDLLTLKVLRHGYGGREELLAMMRNEVEKAGRLSCPLVPRHARYWEDEGLGYVWYDYIEGRPCDRRPPCRRHRDRA